MYVLIGIKRNVVNVAVLVVLMGGFLTGCEKGDSEPSTTLNESVKESDDCVVCVTLASFVKQVKADVGEEHSFSFNVEERYQEMINDGEERYDFFKKQQPLFISSEKSRCEKVLNEDFEEWLPNIERQAEEIAKKQLSCNQKCPQYNCGEYVDFSGMNMEIIELLTLLEGRFLDAALSSADIPGLASSSTQSYQKKLEVLLLEGVNLVEEISARIDKDKNDTYQQKLVDHALQLDDMAQTTTALKWMVSADQQHTSALMDVLSRLAEGNRQFAYQYGQLFRMNDGGKATASIQRDLALSSLLQLGNYHSVLLNLKKTNVGLDTIDADKELACYESLAVKLAVTRELFSIASDTVSQCGLQQNCKTKAYPIFDAITQNQQTTDSLIDKLNDVNGILDKVVYSYTSAKCN